MSFPSSMAIKNITLCFFLIISHFTNSSPTSTWIRGAYWNALSDLPVSDIDSSLFTHLVCSFAFINSTNYHVFINSTYQQSFSSFATTVQRKNPSVVTLLSIWGGNQDSFVFSSMINQSSYRKSFIKSSIETARHYGFHGLDLCCIKPSTSTNMNNLGTLLDDWRAEINSEFRNSNKSQLLLVMSNYHLPVLDSVSYPVESMKRNIDWIHVPAYDYYVPTRDKITGAHSALYGSSDWINTNHSIGEWLNRGVEASKLVLGLPYHGYAWRLDNLSDNGVGVPATGPAITLDGSMGYKLIKSYLQNYGYGASFVYNHTCAANFYKSGTTWINFDDVKAIRAKVSFAKEKGLLGYNVFQLGNDDKWELSSAAKKEGEDPQNKQHLLIIVTVTVVATVMLLLGAIFCCLKRIILMSRVVLGSMKRFLSNIENKVLPYKILKSNANTLQVFSFTTIAGATNNFSSENKIGEGGYGPVYKGRLDGVEIAVKRLSETSHQGVEEFKNEVDLTARLQHVNLVPVLGICTQREEKMLIYEYMPNKSLDFYIFDPWRRYLLDWRKRVHIIEGITQGLLYLQEYSNFTIVHRDLKASNILLDEEMNPKISDFGMARAFAKSECEANTGRIVGTYGYVPPEYVRKGIYSMKYDVYSFGVLLLQIISGKRTSCYYGSSEGLNLLEYAYGLWKDDEGVEFFDSSLDDSSSPWKLTRCLQVALLCVQENPADRPTMLEVYMMLKTESEVKQTPKEPAFSAKRDEDEESKCVLNLQICSINDATITQLVAR